MKYGNDLTLGHTQDGNPLTISREERSMHLYIAGATGCGKSKLLEHAIRSDVLRRSVSGCGLMFFDIHGSLFDSTIDWMAQHGLRHVPVIPFDLRRDDWVLSYNLIRPRPPEEAQTAPIVANFVRAIAHAWGATDLNATPRLAKWLWTLLVSLYENKLTLGEAMHLVRSPDFRHRIAQQVKDPIAQTVWEISSHLDEGEFQEQVESTVSRILKFLGTQVMRATLCQTGLSLDLAAVLKQGAIVPVCLAAERGRVDEEDCRTLGCVLLADLWTAARARGSKSIHRPFYVYVDEFQQFVTPTMAETLDQSRKFGIHFMLAHQTPSQILGRGETGQRVFDAIMANARTKIVFQLDHPKDLPLLTEWLFRNEIDVDAIKYQGHSTHVIGHELTYMRSYSVSRSQGQSAGSSSTRTRSESDSVGRNWTEGASLSDTNGTNTSSGISTTSGRSSNHGTNESESFGGQVTLGNGTTESTSVSRDLAQPRRKLKDELAEEESDYPDLLNLLDEDGEEDEDKIDRLDHATHRVALSHTEGQNTSDSVGLSAQLMRGLSEGVSESTSVARSDGTGTSESRSISVTHSEGGSDARTTGGSMARGQSLQKNRSITHGVSMSPMLMPIYGTESGTPVYRSVAEQLFSATQRIAAQARQHFTLRIVGQISVQSGKTPTVRAPLLLPSRREGWLLRAYEKLPFALRMSEALSRIELRERGFVTPVEEPTSSKRRR